MILDMVDWMNHFLFVETNRMHFNTVSEVLAGIIQSVINFVRSAYFKRRNLGPCL